MLKKALCRDLVDPVLLQLLHFRLERLDFVIANKRSPVILSQAPNNIVSCRLHTLGQLSHNPALLELVAQLINLLADGVAAGALVLGD